MDQIKLHDESTNGLRELFELSKFNDEFLEKRKIFLWGPVTDESSRDIVNRLLYLESKQKNSEITFYISSPGGIVTSGMVIHDTIKMISSPVATVCIGLAASMGSILLASGTKGKRSIWPSARVMIHQPSIGNLFGSASDIQIHAKEIERTKQKSAEILAKYTGKSKEQILADFDRDYWMDANESLKYGIVDAISSNIQF